MLAESGSALHKQVRSGDSAYVVVDSMPDWSDELAYFSAYDLAHPAQELRFRVVESNGSTTWSAVADDAALREVRIEGSADRPDAIHLYDSVSNAMYTLVKRLHYTPGAAIRIEVSQSSRLFDPVAYEVEARILAGGL